MKPKETPQGIKKNTLKYFTRDLIHLNLNEYILSMNEVKFNKGSKVITKKDYNEIFTILNNNLKSMDGCFWLTKQDEEHIFSWLIPEGWYGPAVCFHEVKLDKLVHYTK